MRKKKTTDAERIFDEQFKRWGDRVQFNIFNLGKLHRDWTEAVRIGVAPDEAMRQVVARYRIAPAVEMVCHPNLQATLYGLAQAAHPRGAPCEACAADAAQRALP